MLVVVNRTERAQLVVDDEIGRAHLALKEVRRTLVVVDDEIEEACVVEDDCYPNPVKR